MIDEVERLKRELRTLKKDKSNNKLYDSKTVN